MKNTFRYFIILSICMLTLVSCDLFNKNTKKIDVSEIDLNLEIDRFDQSFFDVDTNDLYNSLAIHREKDSSFFDFYSVNVMRFGHISDSITPTMLDLQHFYTNPYVLELYDTVQKRYGDISPMQEELEESLKHFKYYFPNKQLPAFKTIISEFGYNAVALDSTYILISLDMYLGKDYMYYGSFDFPYYIINRFEPEYIVPNVMEVMFNAYYAPDDLAETDALIHAMIEKGKLYYFKECMQPEEAKHVLIGYNEEQFAWCDNAEGEIWKFYNEHDLFYSKNYMEHSRHIGDGPMTAGMPEQAPGNVGSWVGWQIVNQYMENTVDELSLKELLATPPATILAKSNYKPK
ncbi:MAG: hypothetical protein ACI9O4_001167 [Chitinophagales bacterium]|jgi:hypothetical protein